MRKHHSWWVALLGAGALTACGTAVPAAAADDRGPAWPKVERGESDFSLDGFTVGPLPEGLERHTVKAASSSDREGNRRSEITWVQGSDDLAGHVAVLRSDRIQDLEDLRQERFGHLRTDGLERLGEDEGLDEDAYVSEETGHLFWVERPGVGVATHLDPEQWDREDLVDLAGSVTDIEDADAEAEEAPEEAGAEAAEGDEAAVEEEDAEDAGDAAEADTDATDEVGAETDAEAPVVEDDAVAAEDEDSPAGQDGEAAEEEAPAGGSEETAGEGAEATEDGDAAESEAGDASATEDEAEADTSAEADAEAAEETGGEDTAPADSDSGTDAAQDGDPVRAAEDEQDDRPVTDGSASEGTVQEDGAEQPGAESGDAAGGSALPEGVAFPESSGAEDVSAFHQCVVDRFDERTGLNADDEGVTEETRAFVERTLETRELTGGESDRFLATAWFHGSEADKLRAAEECAEDEEAGGERADHVTGGAPEVVAELDAQARTAFEQARYGDGAADADAVS
ncbi:hypothetical protein IDM40_21885 [Nocardiopsis sp. HNM0947]|uniref:Uncharacterized protein n=1 Tax=Nocardiopsis coralli TaxID=2772213 RepID=A0ABR9PBV9_9ACTN|nr:hypothetical protein [Nocardiopsis coralli]MBE3001322.1 hypothetical protein [Nocardiopsis coralli]